MFSYSCPGSWGWFVSLRRNSNNVERMEKLKAKMMGHFPSVQVEYQELCSFLSQTSAALVGSSLIVPPPGCRSDHHGFPAHKQSLSTEPWVGSECHRRHPDCPFFTERGKKRPGSWTCWMLTHSCCSLQPLSPDCRFYLAQHSILDSILRAASSILRPPCLGLFLPVRDSKLMVPVRSLHLLTSEAWRFLLRRQSLFYPG